MIPSFFFAGHGMYDTSKEVTYYYPTHESDQETTVITDVVQSVVSDHSDANRSAQSQMSFIAEMWKPWVKES